MDRTSAGRRPRQVRSSARWAIVIGGKGTAVPVARSLGAAGVQVAALGAEPWEPVRFSRHCTQYFAPAGRQSDPQDAWMAWLEREARSGAVLIPCSDEGLELIASHAARLAELGYVSSHEPALVRAMLDKAETYRLAREIGVATPRTLVTHDVGDLDPERAGFGFPCAYKPVVSHRFARHFRTKAFIVRNAGELAEAHRLTQAHGLEMMLTEVIHGDDDQLVAYVSHLGADGRPVVEYTHQKLRQWPTGFGLASYAVSGWEPEVARTALRFLRHVGLCGVSEVEFKRDARDGVWKLIECNYRFTIDVVGAADDLPTLAYQRALGIADAPARPVRLGSHLWNPLSDLRSLGSLRRRGQLSAAEWARSLRRPLRTHVFRADDPLPTVGYHAGLAFNVALERVNRRGQGRVTARVAPERGADEVREVVAP
jgi:predicted ATP-grasp superfamily ATP-dependent carboligase